MIKVVDDLTVANGITHKGSMHADEVFATAFLDLYFGNFNVMRVASVPLEISDDIIVYDIGGGIFDHHGVNARVRDNSIKYSSFGLLFEAFGLKYLEKIGVLDAKCVYDYFVKDFVLAIDAIDNGMFPDVKANYRLKSVSDIIELFNPSYDSSFDYDTKFIEACNLAKIIFNEELRFVISRVKAQKEIDEILENNDEEILVLDHYVPYKEAILNSVNGYKVKLVIYKSNREDFAIGTVPKSLTDKNCRVYFPKKWAGLKGRELEEVTNVPSSCFCHVNRFIASAKTKDAAMRLAKLTLDVNEKI